MTLTRRLYIITAVATGLVILGLLGIIIHPMDFAEKDMEKLYHENEGLIWFIGLILGLGLTILTFINGQFQSELKECADRNNESQKTIQAQNKNIIQNQNEYITEIRILNEQINKNNKHDIEALQQIQKQNETIDSLFRRVEDGEKEIKRATQIGKRLSSIEDLLKLHDKELSEINKKIKA